MIDTDIRFKDIRLDRLILEVSIFLFLDSFSLRLIKNPRTIRNLTLICSNNDRDFFYPWKIQDSNRNFQIDDDCQVLRL